MRRAGGRLRSQPERAARLAGAACQLRESLGHGTGIGPRIEQVLEFARGQIGTSAAALFAEGREMPAEEAVAFALGAGQAASGSPRRRGARLDRSGPAPRARNQPA